eukprot:m.77860 g.77860  ORF g.77860 m.77860 type:complete len:301 (+) comp11931_c0_seq4:128-1030(+)
MFPPFLDNSGIDVALVLQNTSSNSSCIYPWTNKYLGECVHNDVQFAGLFIGLFSIVCWMFAQIPQIYKNFKNGEASGLSGVFLADWLAGDITNLVGCILTKQVPTQLYTAIWFCIIDTTMLVQWIFYAKIKKPKSKEYIVGSVLGLGLLCPLIFYANLPAEGVHDSIGHSSRTLLKINSFSSGTAIAGWTIGWVSGLMYFTSRIPQIMKNYKRKSCEGLSLVMFLMAILGNCAYAMGVLMQSVETDFIIDHLPWLLGSVGTLFFDFTIFFQFLYYGAEHKQTDEEARLSKNVTEKDPLLQ